MIWRAMALYIKTTLDEYEFPVAVAGSALELAMMLNTFNKCSLQLHFKKT